MNAANELAMDVDEDDLFGEWFERTEELVALELDPHGEGRGGRRGRVGVVVAAISTAGLALAFLHALAGRV